MRPPKTDRNKDLVEKKDNEKYSFRDLAAHFNITVSRAHEIYHENKDKLKKKSPTKGK